MAEEPQVVGGQRRGQSSPRPQDSPVLLPGDHGLDPPEGGVPAPNRLAAGFGGQGNGPVLQTGAGREGAQRWGRSLEGQVLNGG